ncbi:cytochrome b [Magnetovibrio sp. PR-2]|uniref:cytochrome b n=1 Tax=Magnetovibrio sp. PR-2 TaxID=3120356 RepID=UPI002FCE4CAF
MTSPDSLKTSSIPITSRWRNSDRRWGGVSVVLHWTMALAVFGLFGLGLWMTSLSYYDPWYKQGPSIHKAMGVLLFATLLVRLAWRAFDHTPAPLRSHSALERKGAHAAHVALYAGLCVVMLSGYLISTADGRAIDVFGLFEVPATLSRLKNQEDIAGVVHLWLASGLVGVAVLHGGAALKHHVLDKDATLLRMLGRSTKSSSSV